jgi:glycosyltransferase involved in cell wall biosynthesis
MIFFSVILSIHNGERYLSDCINSILNQTLTNFELLIFDDASLDNTQNILKSYNDVRIRHFKSEKNIGLTSALNYLIYKSNGKYIVRIDDDDLMDINRLEILYQKIDNRDNLFLYSNFYTIDSSGKIISNSNLNNIDILDQLNKGLNPICHGSICFMKSHSIHYNEKFRYSQDLLFYFENLSNYEIFFVDNFLYYYRINQESISFYKSLGQLNTKLFIFKKFYSKLNKLMFLKRILKKFYYTFYILIFDNKHIYQRHLTGKHRK